MYIIYCTYPLQNVKTLWYCLFLFFFEGSTNVNSVSCLISAQELTCEKQEIIDEVLKRHVHLYTEHHKLSTPTDVVTFFEHTTKAYNLTVESLGVNRELCLESVSFNIGVAEGNYSIFRKAPTGRMERELNTKNMIFCFLRYI